MALYVHKLTCGSACFRSIVFKGYILGMGFSMLFYLHSLHARCSALCSMSVQSLTVSFVQIFVQFCIFGTRADWKKSLCDCGCDCSCSCAGGSTGERQPLVINGKEGQGRTDALQSVPPPGAQ